jgi:hypothetical protein
MRADGNRRRLHLDRLDADAADHRRVRAPELEERVAKIRAIDPLHRSGEDHRVHLLRELSRESATVEERRHVQRHVDARGEDASRARPVGVLRDPSLVGRVASGTDHPEPVGDHFPGDAPERAAVLQHVHETFVGMAGRARDRGIPEIEIDDRDAQPAAAPLAGDRESHGEAFGIVREAGDEKRAEGERTAGLGEAVDDGCERAARRRGFEELREPRSHGHRFQPRRAEERKIHFPGKALGIRVALRIGLHHHVTLPRR